MDKTNISSFFKKYTMVIALVLITLFFTWRTGGSMLLPQNVNNLIAQNAYVFVLATGMLLCILTGGNIDLSVGSVVCFVGAIGGDSWNPALAMIIMLLTGTAIGVWQGFWIAYVRIPPFITTLAGMLIFRGLSNVVLNGLTIAPMPASYLALFNSYLVDIMPGHGINMTCMLVGVIATVIFLASSLAGRASKAKKGYTLKPMGGFIARCVIISLVILVFSFRLAQYKGIPTVLIWLLLIILIYGYITSKTTIGRHFYAINTNRVYFLAYANMGMLAAVAAMITIARLNSANPTAGTNYEMDAIGSCFIGGASAYGGTGTVAGVIIGATLMGVINLGMSIMGVDANWQKVVKGCVLLAAVIFDVVSKKRAK